MKTTVILLFFVTGLCFTFCGAKGQSILPTKTLHVNPDYVQGGTVSQIFDSITYIPLETNKESIFGHIQYLQVTEHYFAFFDYSTQGVFVFDKKGRYVGKIKTAPGLNDFWELTNFVLSPYSEQIYLAYSTWDKHKKAGIIQLAIFKPDGELVKSEPLDTTTLKGVNEGQFSMIDSTTALFSNNLSDSSRKFYFTIIQGFHKKLKDLKAVASGDPFMGASRSYHRSSTQNGNTFWSRGHDYTFFASVGEQLQPYKMLLPQKLSLDSSFYKDSSLTKPGNALNEFDKKNTKLVTGLSQLFACGPLQFFTFIRGYYSSVMDSYFYNQANGHLYGLSKITPDSTTGYLPIVSVSPAVADSQYVYSTVASFELFQAKEEAAERHPVYGPVMAQYFSTQNRKSNPVIVVLKPKKNL